MSEGMSLSYLVCMPRTTRVSRHVVALVPVLPSSSRLLTVAAGCTECARLPVHGVAEQAGGRGLVFDGLRGRAGGSRAIMRACSCPGSALIG